MTQWSNQQVEIFDWFRDGTTNAVVRARAGTGKTTVIIEGISYAQEHRVGLMAFNKSIAVELNERLDRPGAEAKTLHSIGYGFVRQHWSKIELDTKPKRAWNLAEICCPGATDDIKKEVCKLASKLKAVEPLIKGGQFDLAIAAADRFGIAVDEEQIEKGQDMKWLAAAAIQMLVVGCEHQDGTIDFDDMIWLPVRNGWARPKYQLVVIDEAQDMNTSQIRLAQSVCCPDGRICVVGDDRQAIYGFRGADSGSIDRLKTALDAQEFGLNTTYRCGTEIVAEAAKLVPDFLAADSNPAGEIKRKLSVDDLIEGAGIGDFVLSRTNAPLVSICLKLLRKGKPANIEGRDVGRGLTALARRIGSGKARNDMMEFHRRLDRWLDNETKKARARGAEGLQTIARLNDQHGTMECLIEGLGSVADLNRRIDKLFSDTQGEGQRTILSSVHKSKGLESETVWLLQDTFFSKKKDPPEWVSQQEEDNIEYVAITRAKSLLCWVVGGVF